MSANGLVDRWDDTRIKAGANWREEIQKALAAARVAILLVSADFIASDFINSDELPPLLAAAKAQGVTIIPVIVSASEFTKTNLSQFQAVNNPSKPLNGMNKAAQEQTLVQVAEAVRDAIGKPDEFPPERLSNVPIRNLLFTGREDILAKIEQALRTQGRAALSGLGGVGKTQTATEYAYRHEREYDRHLLGQRRNSRSTNFRLRGNR